MTEIEKQIRIVTMADEEYPVALKEIHKPPEVLYCRGRYMKADARYIAVVGARKATVYGKWGAFETGKYLAQRGIVVVSGLAFGIDAQAHRGALDAGGRTIAVLGSGVDICYPAAHKNLMQEILQNGTVISEFPPGVKSQPWHFPQRNRIISGMSKAVIIPEAGSKSGSLITAGYALEQNRDIYVFPGNINSASSEGCNRLLKEGAEPVISISQIGEELQMTGFLDAGLGRGADLGADEAQILMLIREKGTVSAEWLMSRAEIPCGQVQGILSVLEIKGMIYRQSGKIMIAI